MPRHWKPEEDEALRRLYPDYLAIGKTLPHRSHDRILRRCSTLGLTSKSPGWDDREIAILLACYPDYDQARVRIKGLGLAERTAMAVKMKSGALGLSRGRLHRGGKRYVPKGHPDYIPQHQREYYIEYRKLRARPKRTPQARYKPAPHVLASASPREDGYSLMVALHQAAKHIRDQDARLDIISSAALLILEGEFREDQAGQAVLAGVKQHNRFCDRFRTISLDTPIRGTENLTLMDVLAA